MGTTDEMPTAIKEKNQWDPIPIPIIYTELFPKLIENGLMSQFIWHHSSIHFPDGTMLMLDATTTPGFQVTQQKIAMPSNTKSKI